MNIVTSAKRLFSSLLSRNEKVFVFSAMACSFFISFEYAITRPASDAIFLSLYTFKAFPIVWILVVPINFLVIHIYNRLLPRFGCLKLFTFIVLSIISINTFSAFFILNIKYLAFIQYICKDIYILLMFKQLWSLIHTTVKQKNAKYLYGIIFGAGGIGASLGSVTPSFFAVQMGSKNLFFFTVPIYALLFIGYFSALKTSRLIGASTSEEYKNDFDVAKKSFRSFFTSKYLVFILLIVVSMQVSISLVDYQFNYLMEKSIALLDQRTQYMGRVHLLINILTSVMQFFGAGILLHYVGLKRTHFFLPLFLCINAVLLIFFPIFGIASFVFISIKSLDYSIFSISREMLYIPMNLEEKFRAKAVIDVFAYRTAKAIGSLLLLGLRYIFVLEVSYTLIGMLSVSLFIVWMIFVLFLFRHYRLRAEQYQTAH